MTSIQIFGIIAGIFLSGIGLILNAFATYKNIRSRRLSNYQEITKSHREIWKLSIDTPEKFERIFDVNPNLIENPISSVEARYIQLVLLHMTSAFNFSKENEMIEIEKLKFDFDNFLSFPLPRKIWNRSKRFYNKDFVSFIDNPYQRKLTLLEKFYDIKPKSRALVQNTWNVLLLSGTPELLQGLIIQYGDVVILPDLKQEITRNFIERHDIDFIICFGYSKIIKKEIIELVDVINIHFSLLPLHKGPNPHLWSWLKNTKKGITIHYINEKVDDGDIIMQLELTPDNGLTLQSSFDYFNEEAVRIFSEAWPLIRNKSNQRIPQVQGGTKHKMSDQEPIKELFQNGGLQLPIKEFVAQANELIEKS